LHFETAEEMGAIPKKMRIYWGGGFLKIFHGAAQYPAYNIYGFLISLFSNKCQEVHAMVLNHLLPYSHT
jgi:hypothetical protein